MSTLGKFTFDLRLFTLLCDEETLKSRLLLDSSRKTDVELTIKRLKQTMTIDSKKNSTIGKTPEKIVQEIIRKIYA